MAVGQHRVVGPLVVDERAIAALGVADGPMVVDELQHRMNARAERIGQHDRAIRIAADAAFDGGVEEKRRAGASARRHRQIAILGGRDDGHQRTPQVGQAFQPDKSP